MSKKLHNVVKTEGSPYLQLLVGMSARNPLGFLYLWTHVFSFGYHTAKAKGCVGLLPGVVSPLEVMMVSYWESEEDLKRFVGSPAHVRWMRFIMKFPTSLNLFNETYSAPRVAMYINKPKGYARCIEFAKEGR